MRDSALRSRAVSHWSGCSTHVKTHAPERLRLRRTQAATPVTTREQYAWIASVSANSEEIGGILADAMMRVGTDGEVLAEEGPDLTDTTEFTEGMELDTGFLSPKLVKDQESMTTMLDQPRVLVTDEKLQLMGDLVGLLEQVAAWIATHTYTRTHTRAHTHT